MNDHRGGMTDVNLDVAEYLHLQYEIPETSMETIKEEVNFPVEIGTDGIDEESGTDVAHSYSSEEKVKHSSSLLWNDGYTEKDDETELITDEIPLKESHSFDKPRKGNPQLRSFVKENLVRIPTKIKARLPHKHISMLSQLPLLSVPIVENRNEEEDDTRSALSIPNSGSIVVNGEVLHQSEQDGIDSESVKHATRFICKGENWANKSERMLRRQWTRESLTMKQVLKCAV